MKKRKRGRKGRRRKRIFTFGGDLGDDELERVLERICVCFRKWKSKMRECKWGGVSAKHRERGERV